MNPIHVDLAQASRASVIAPAGCGKTHLIADAVASAAGCQLILTHTHAGVDAVRRRLKSMGIPSTRYQVSTIDGWALKYASAYTGLSGLISAMPQGDQWKTIHGAAVRVLAHPELRRVVQASYDGVFVDEYQDCTIQQHGLVLALAAILPCRVLGDPLQSIFRFRGVEPIEWETNVIPHFPPIEGPSYPWRWHKGDPTLGKWLLEARDSLLKSGTLDLRGAPIKQQRLPRDGAIAVQIATCHVMATKGESVVAIRQRPQQCHEISGQLGGAFSCVEPIYTNDLFLSAERIETTQGGARVAALVEFASTCLTAVGPELRTIVAAISTGRVQRTSIYKHQVQLKALLAVAENPSLDPVIDALDALSKVPGAKLYRRELFDEMRRAVVARCAGEHDSLRDAAWKVRELTSKLGRRLPRLTVGRPTLIKGLEFDHAVVLDADELDLNSLYVAITRGSKSLTILSRSEVLQPTPTGQAATRVISDR